MTANGWFQIGLYLFVIFLVTKPIGVFMTRVFNRERTFLDSLLSPIERLVYRLTGVDEKRGNALDGVRCGHAPLQRRLYDASLSHRTHPEVAAAQSAEIWERRIPGWPLALPLPSPRIPTGRYIAASRQ